MTTTHHLIAEEVAERLRCNTFTARRLMAAGEIEAAKVAGRWIASESAVDAYVRSQMNTQTGTRRRRRRA